MARTCKIRQAAVNALGSHAGSVVVMEAQTGKVLTIVNQDWAVRSGDQAVFDDQTRYRRRRPQRRRDQQRGRFGHAIPPTRRDLDDAIAFSDNGYFQRVGANLGSPKMIEYAKDLGLGEPTGPECSRANIPGSCHTATTMRVSIRMATILR